MRSPITQQLDGRTSPTHDSLSLHPPSLCQWAFHYWLTPELTSLRSLTLPKPCNHSLIPGTLPQPPPDASLNAKWDRLRGESLGILSLFGKESQSQAKTRSRSGFHYPFVLLEPSPCPYSCQTECLMPVLTQASLLHIEFSSWSLLLLPPPLKSFPWFLRTTSNITLPTISLAPELTTYLPFLGIQPSVFR